MLCDNSPQVYQSHRYWEYCSALYRTAKYLPPNYGYNVLQTTDCRLWTNRQEVPESRKRHLMHQRARGAFFLILYVFSLFILNFSQSLFYIFSFSPPFPVLYYDKVAQRKLRRYRHKGQIIPPLAVIPFLRRVVHYGKNQAASPLRRSNSGRIRPGPAEVPDKLYFLTSADLAGF